MSGNELKKRMKCKTKAIPPFLIVWMLLSLFCFILPSMAESVKDADMDYETEINNGSLDMMEETNGPREAEEIETADNEDADPTNDAVSMGPLGLQGETNYGHEREPIINTLSVKNDLFSGALIYSYSLTLPPGRNGLQPELKLTYNNQSGSKIDIFGHNWSLGIPYIERINRRGVEKIYTEELFYSSLDGELKKIRGNESPAGGARSIAGTSSASGGESDAGMDMADGSADAGVGSLDSLQGGEGARAGAETPRGEINENGDEIFHAVYYPLNLNNCISAYARNWGGAYNANPGNILYEDKGITIGSWGDWSGTKHVYRSFFSFDTSDLPEGVTYLSAAFHARGYGKYSDALLNYICLVKTEQKYDTFLELEDFCRVGATKGSQDIYYDDFILKGFNAWELNEDGRSWISTTGITKLGLREGNDIEKNIMNFPGNTFVIHSARAAPDYRPYLKITYTISSPTSPTRLRIDGKESPVEIASSPVFTAVYNDPNEHDLGKECQIQVKLSGADWSDPFWDSGRMALETMVERGERCPPIQYTGPALSSDAAYLWRIRFWDIAGHQGLWSGGNDYFGAAPRFGSKVEGGQFLEYEFIEGRFWKATDKKGTMYIFGRSRGARQDDEDNEHKIYTWMLEEIRDANDNYISYEYQKDKAQIYPSRITYTGHGSDDGMFVIEFTLENRGDIKTAHHTGFETTTRYRVASIRTSVNGEWARNYDLNYTTGDNGSRSLLHEIVESGRDMDAGVVQFNATRFDYEKAGHGWLEDANWVIPIDFIGDWGMDRGVRLADINGDGLIDILYTVEGHPGANKVYLNKGDGTGWIASNWRIPVQLVGYHGADSNARLADIDGDGLVDILHAPLGSNHVKQVFFNNGNGSWRVDGQWRVPVEFTENSATRLADVNGDGMPDILRSRAYWASDEVWVNDRKVYINGGPGVGWVEDPNWLIPRRGSFTLNMRPSVRFADVNGDGLTDILDSMENGSANVFINKGDGTGWFHDVNRGIPGYFEPERGARLADVNGDGLTDLLWAPAGSNHAKYVYIGNGSGWSRDGRWTPPVGFAFNHDYGARIADCNGDGLPDILISHGRRQVFINQGNKADTLTRITTRKGAEIRISYKGSPQYVDESGNLSNPSLPYPLYTVSQIRADDGLGNISTLTYAYEGGDYYFNNPYDRKISGFNKVKATNSMGRTTIACFHQGNETDSGRGEWNDDISKRGREYRSEVHDDTGRLYSKTISKWEHIDLGDDRDFVKSTRIVDFTYDGNTTHKDKAVSFSYDDSNGNLVEKITHGEVAGNDDGTFADIGDDHFSTKIAYAENDEKHILGLPSHEVLVDRNSDKVAETRYYYDEQDLGVVNVGNPTKEEMWARDSEYIDSEKEYNEYGLITLEKDPRDKITSYTYDPHNLYVASAINALNHETRYTHDYSSGGVKTLTDPNGHVFETVYDGFDRVLEEKQPDPANPSTLVVKTSYEYNDVDFPRRIKQTNHLDDANAFDVHTCLDGFDRVIQVRKEAEEADQFSVIDFDYNNIGLLEKESWPYFSTGSMRTEPTSVNELYTVFTYDPLQRITSIVNAVGATTYAYDDWSMTVTDAENNIKVLHRDARGNLVRVEERNDGEIYSTNYQYNPLNQLTIITDAMGNIRNFTYDGLGRLTSAEDLHDPTDAHRGITLYEYDEAANPTSITDPKNQTVAYQYDDINRVMGEDYSEHDGVEVIYNYDSCANGVGRLCSATSEGVESSYIYTPLGSINVESRTIDSTGYQTRFEYDRQSNTVSIITPDNSEMKYDYNNAGQLEKVAYKDDGEQTFTDIIKAFDYSPLEQIKEQVYSNNTASGYTYDPNKLYRLTHKRTTSPSGLLLQDIAYSHDNVGNITRIEDASNTNSAKTVDFIYDDLYRLTRAASSNVPNGQNYTRIYNYNPIGNIIYKSDQGVYSYAGARGESYANPHAVTSIGGRSLLYDNNGNLISDGGDWSFSWDYNNRMKSAANGSKTIEYTYDHTGQRVKVDNGLKITHYPNKYFNTAFTNALKGDVNGDGVVDLIDAKLALEANSGKKTPDVRDDYAFSGADVNNDGKIGSEETGLVLQIVSGLRNVESEAVQGPVSKHIFGNDSLPSIKDCSPKGLEGV